MGDEKGMIAKAVKRAREDQREEMRRSRLAIEKDLSRTTEAVFAAPIVWTGKLRDLGILILELHTQGKIKASSRTNAVQQMASHFVDKHGKKINVHSLWENTIQKKAKEKGEPG